MQNIIKIVLILCVTNLYANQLEKISLQLQWKHQFEFAGFYAAKEKGFYEELGLDVEFIEFQENINITNEVLNGNTQYGLSYSSVIAEYLNGKPLILVASFFKQSPLVLITQKNILTPADLKDKRVMGLSDSIDNITLLTMLNKFGVTIDDIIDISTNFTIDDFITKKVDAMSVFTTNELYYLNKSGIQYNIFDPVVYGAKYYDVNLFTSQEELTKHPERVKKMKEASIKGWIYALEHKDEIIDLILQKYNTQNKSKDALRFEAAQIEHIILPDVHKIGSIDSDRIKIIAESFVQNGFSKNMKNIESFIYKDFLNPLNLTDKELDFIKQHPKIVLGTEKSWVPYVIVTQDGKITGYDQDVLDKINKLSGANFTLKAGKWQNMIEEAKNHTIDGLSTGGVHKERKEYLNFSTTYCSLQKIVITSQTNPKNIHSLKDLKGKIIAIHTSNLVDEKLAKKFPNSTILRLKSIDNVIMSVITGKADAMFGNGATLYYANKIGLPYLEFTTFLNHNLELSFGVRKDWPEAISIIDKALQHIGKEELLTLQKKWFHINDNKEPFDYALFWKFIIFIVFIGLFIIVRHYNIKKVNNELKKRVKEELEKSRTKDQVIFQQNKLASMGEMIENIAHQWRQPLSQVNSAVFAIDDIMYEAKIENEIIKEKLSEIESLTKYMSNTINDFQNYLNPHKRKEKFAIKKLLEDSISIIEGSLIFTNITINIIADKKTIYYGYKNELQQVIVIILNNAKDILFNKNVQSPVITIELTKDLQNHKIFISDNGGGIDTAIINKIFEPYFTTKHKSQGVGLGLYISKMIVEESLNGKLNVHNADDGACFEIILKVENEY